MNDEYCSNWPKWLRYLLTIPGALIVWWLSGSFLPHLFTFYFDRNSLGYEITQALVGGIASTYLAQSILYTMPPKHKLWFVSIPSICYLFLIFFDFIYYYIYGATWQTLLMLISALITCLIMLYTFIKNEVENNAKQKIENSNVVKNETDKEILGYINEKASQMNLTPEEYIKKVKEYEEYQKNNIDN